MFLFYINGELTDSFSAYYSNVNSKDGKIWRAMLAFPAAPESLRNIITNGILPDDYSRYL